MTALPPPAAARVLFAAAGRRKDRWLAEAPGATPELWNAAIRALVGPGKSIPSITWWLASGVPIDVLDGLPPSREVPIPPRWKQLPAEVQAVIGLPMWFEHWTRHRPQPHPEAEQARKAMLLASEAEFEQDEPLRAFWTAAARDRANIRPV